MSYTKHVSNIAIIDRISEATERGNGSVRSLSSVNALVLHQTGFTRGNDITAYDRLGVHFVIIPDGRIIQLFDESINRPASSLFNRRSVAVEFVGNFPLKPGKWWTGSTANNIPSKQQIASGRGLIVYLQSLLSISHVFAHRQATPPSRRGNCPGPHIWFNIGEWAIARGLSDGGENYAVGNGGAIPDDWRDQKYNLMDGGPICEVVTTGDASCNIKEYPTCQSQNYNEYN